MELDLQKNYVSEAASRYEATRIFRHDFKNHIITLGGLIQKNECAKAADYLRRFEAVSDSISYPVNTGNVAIDIILSDKLSYAKAAGIQVTYDIVIPTALRIDDFDLSVIFSNSIDNAIKACLHVAGDKKVLDIAAKQTKQFFLLDITNS